MIQKLPKTKQIELVLSERVFEIVDSYPNPNELLDNHRFVDFIDVTESELFAYVQEHGFPSGNVAEEGGSFPFHGDNQYRIEFADNAWQLFYAERGQKNQEQSFETQEAARKRLVEMLFESAKITLNHRYIHAHPELDERDPAK